MPRHHTPVMERADVRSDDTNRLLGWLDGLSNPPGDALTRMRGRWRVLASLPLLLMIPVLVVTIKGYVNESNLWPLPLILLSPLALFYMGILFWSHSRAKRSEKTA